MKDYDKNKEPSYLKYLDVKTLNDWAMSPKPPVNILSGSKILDNLMKIL